MAISKDTLQWVFGVLLTIIAALTSVAYTSATARITQLESQRNEAVEQATQLRANVAVLQSMMLDARRDLTDLKVGQAATRDQLDFLVGNARDFAKWRRDLAIQATNDSRRWNDAIDKQPPVKGKK